MEFNLGMLWICSNFVGANVRNMKELRFIGIIPARYASTRFPGKPLAMLGGKYVIQRVYEQVSRVLPNVVVALDDDRIAAAVDSFGGRWVMTHTDHKCGTDRCLEAYLKNGGEEDVVINIQGDEPFVQPSQLEAIMQCFSDAHPGSAKLAKHFDGPPPFPELETPTSPKVVVDRQWNAKYFSRSVVPYVRNAEKAQWPAVHQFYTHLGMYAYRADVLKRITGLPQSALEIAESLEQLRWLENGYKIKVGVTDVETIGIDTPQDLENAEQFLRKHQE